MQTQQTLSLWLNNDQPMNMAARDGIQKNHAALTGVKGAAWGLRSLVEDVLFNAPGMYQDLCKAIDYPPNLHYFLEIQENVIVSELDSVDWGAIVRDLDEDIDW